MGDPIRFQLFESVGMHTPSGSQCKWVQEEEEEYTTLPMYTDAF